MEKLSRTELKILNFIRSGKRKSDILSEKILSPASFGTTMTSIYSKTDEVVKYHTARNKFEELACYLRNNPDAFGSLSEANMEECCSNEVVIKEAVEKIAENIVIPSSNEEEITWKVKKAFNKVSTKLKAKLEVLDEVFTEIAKELEG